MAMLRLSWALWFLVAAAETARQYRTLFPLRRLAMPYVVTAGVPAYLLGAAFFTFVILLLSRGRVTRKLAALVLGLLGLWLPYFFLLYPVFAGWAEKINPAAVNFPESIRVYASVLAATAAYGVARISWRTCSLSLVKDDKRLLRSGVGLALAIGIWVLATVPLGRVSQSLAADTVSPPNILLLTVDALESSHMSLFGYSQPTTPFLDSRSPELLKLPHTHAAGSATFVSVAALLSARHPLESGITSDRVALLPSQRGKTLLSFLEKRGYRFVGLNHRHFDSNNMEIRPDAEGGEWGRAQGHTRAFFGRGAEFWAEAVPKPVAKPLSNLFYRYSYNADETVRLQGFLKSVLLAQSPFIAHYHFLTTHCCEYPLEKRYFHPREGIEDEDNRYDNAVRNVDEYLKRVFKVLEEASLLDKTVVVIASDHARGQKRRPEVEVPILFRFPKGEHAGRVRRVVSFEVFGPTLLNYLQVPQPEWMSGQSVLHRPPQEIAQGAIAVMRYHFGEAPRNSHLSVRDPLVGLESVVVLGCDESQWLDPQTALPTQSARIARLNGLTCEPGRPQLAGLTQRAASLLERLRANRERLSP